MADNLSAIMETIGLERYQELKAGGATEEEIAEAVQRMKTTAEESNVVIFSYTPDFVKPIEDKAGNVIGERICAPLLAEYIRENLRYFFVRDSANSAVRRYVYKKTAAIAYNQTKNSRTLSRHSLEAIIQKSGGQKT